MMVFVLFAQQSDYDDWDCIIIAVYPTKAAAERGMRDMEHIRDRIHQTGDVTMHDFWYSNFDRGEYLTREAGENEHPSWQESWQKARDMWPTIKAIIGDAPYDWFDSNWGYEIIEARDGLSFPEVKHDR